MGPRPRDPSLRQIEMAFRDALKKVFLRRGGGGGGAGETVVGPGYPSLKA